MLESSRSRTHAIIVILVVFFSIPIKGGLKRIQDSSLNHNRFRLGFFCETFIPSSAKDVQLVYDLPQTLLFAIKIKYIVPSILLLIFYVTPAYAYLDPGTGSILLQGILSVIASVITNVLLY
jgi:hypothetical protein